VLSILGSWQAAQCVDVDIHGAANHTMKTDSQSPYQDEIHALSTERLKGFNKVHGDVFRLAICRL